MAHYRPSLDSAAIARRLIKIRSQPAVAAASGHPHTLGLAAGAFAAARTYKRQVASHAHRDLASAITAWIATAAPSLGLPSPALLTYLPWRITASWYRIQSMQSAGAAPGWPDMLLAYPRGCDSGLWLYLVPHDAHCTPAQAAIRTLLCTTGYQASLISSIDQARDVITGYCAR